ncbi:hypothetical protein QAD02_000039 [Eretmocerus hayati]|uniref:Uncharacterized protein n=1 Tax=Eretmocerus hayati TaxID=131215 RepID=A0ACC2NCA8_9HYME|nr:hypothetical protein QAD02_000039 [Eretmocerus hayati]
MQTNEIVVPEGYPKWKESHMDVLDCFIDWEPLRTTTAELIDTQDPTHYRIPTKIDVGHDKVTDNLDPSNLEYSGEDSSDDDYEPSDDGSSSEEDEYDATLSRKSQKSQQQLNSTRLEQECDQMESSQTVNKLSESNGPRGASVTEETISIDGHPSNSSLSTLPHATSTSATIDHEECLNGGSTAQHGQDSILCEIGATGTADTNDERFHNFSSSTLIDADQEMEIQGNKIEQSPVAEHLISNEEDTLLSASESEAEEKTDQKLTKKQRPPSPKITCPVAESIQQKSFEAREELIFEEMKMQMKLPLPTITPVSSTSEVGTVSQPLAESNKKKFCKKINYCSHCERMFSRIDRHLFHVHKDLQEVQQILHSLVRTKWELSKEQKKRLILIEWLRFNMNHVWDNDRVKNPTGIILAFRRRHLIQAISRQRTEQDVAEDISASTEVKRSVKSLPVRIPCKLCFGWFATPGLDSTHPKQASRNVQPACQDPDHIIRCCGPSTPVLPPGSKN